MGRWTCSASLYGWTITKSSFGYGTFKACHSSTPQSDSTAAVRPCVSQWTQSTSTSVGVCQRSTSSLTSPPPTAPAIILSSISSCGGDCSVKILSTHITFACQDDVSRAVPTDRAWHAWGRFGSVDWKSYWHTRSYRTRNTCRLAASFILSSKWPHTALPAATTHWAYWTRSAAAFTTSGF